MTLVGAQQGQHVSASVRWGPVALLAWCLLGVAVFAAMAFYLYPDRLASFGDTDDATRLIEVRELLGGASWFDMTQPRLGGPDPLVSHWSRLIDLPIATLLSLFELVMPAARAELLVRAVWPLTVLLAFAYLMGRICEERGGRAAALLGVALTLTCNGTVQFVPGRIDHHNAIILCTVGGILLLARSFDDPNRGWVGGILLGLGTAIGYESLALTTACLGAGVLYGLLPGRSLLGPSRVAVTFAATLAIAFAATTAPDAFLDIHCDALSINLVMLAVIGALGVCVAQALEHRLSLVAKVLLLAAVGGIGIALYGAVEPACLRGPFGQVDPAIIPMWLSTVSETQSILSYGSLLPISVLMAIAYFAAGIYFGVKMMRTERDDELRFQLLALLISVPLSFWQIKLIPYATYLAVPLIAVGLARPSQPAKPRPVGRRISLTEVLALLAMGGIGWLLVTLAKPSMTRVNEQVATVRDCVASSSITPLAALPRGLAVTDVNLGPYLVALTNLDALSAPYHRLGKSIVAAHEILHAPPTVAEQRLRDIGATYVITCEGLDSTTSPTPDPPDALQTLLFAGKPPSFLEPVPLAQPTPLKVWRVTP